MVLNTPKYLFNSVIFRIFPEGRSQNAFLIQLSLEYFQKASFVLFNKYVFGKKYTRETIKLCQTKSFSSGTVFLWTVLQKLFPLLKDTIFLVSLLFLSLFSFVHTNNHILGGYTFLSTSSTCIFTHLHSFREFTSTCS